MNGNNTIQIKKIRGLTTIEALVGVVLFAIVIGALLGFFTVIKRYFENDVALINSQATARIAIERMVRPDMREGSSFVISDGGNTLTLNRYDGTIFTYTFSNDDGDDTTYVDNKIKLNGNTIGTNIIKLAGTSIFQELAANRLIEINFGVRNEGVDQNFQDVHVSTVIKLRN